MKKQARINWGAVVSAGSPHYQRNEAIRQLDDCLHQHGTVDLFDVFFEKNRGGHYIIRELDRRSKSGYESSGTYKFRVLKNHDQHGHNVEARPGDVYWLEGGKKETFVDPRDGAVKPMNTRQKRTMLRKHRERGDENDPINWARLPIDDDCCVTVNFFQASSIIVNRTSQSIYDEDMWHFEPYYEDEAAEKPRRGRRPKAELTAGPDEMQAAQE